MTISIKQSGCGDGEPFWRRKTLDEMTAGEWESLCDGCGRCCLVKLEDDDTGEVHYTSVGCRLYDAERCRCSNYAKRSEIVTDCVTLTPAAIGELEWLPPTCAYRLVADGKDLFWWHPLVSGTQDSVHRAGISVRGRVTGSEEEVEVEALPDRIVRWPTRLPRRARHRG